MATRRIRWGLIGASRFADRWAVDAIRDAGGTISAVAARDVHEARAFAVRHRLPAATPNYQELLRRDDIDAVYIALPPGLHAEIGAEALLAGKAVICQKPAVTSAADANFLSQAVAAAAPVAFSDGFMYRCLPQYRIVTAAVASGMIGSVQLIRGVLRSPWPRHDDYRLLRGASGGVLVDLGCYVLDFAWAILARPLVALWARTVAYKGVDVTWNAVLGSGADTAVVFHCSFGGAWIASPVEVWGTHGSIYVDHMFDSGERGAHVRIRSAKGSEVELRCTPSRAFAREVANLHDGIRSTSAGTEPLSRRLQWLGDAFDVCREAVGCHGAESDFAS